MNGEHLTRDIQRMAGDLKKNLSEKSEVIDKTENQVFLFMLSFLSQVSGILQRARSSKSDFSERDKYHIKTC